MPTRLIKIDKANFSCNLIDSAGHQTVEYIALSHRWGGAKVIQTTSVNIERHKKRIEFADLNLTFQHAVMSTARLGLEHLWIDSLCIIQDSASDWAHEASRMAVVYRNAYLTLAAACATSGDSGLYHERRDGRSVQLSYTPPESNNTYPIFFVSNRYENVWTFREEVDLGSLGTRAWCMQERFLSKRTLHFGRTKLLWECQEMAREEDEHPDMNAGSMDRFGDNSELGFLRHFSSFPWLHGPMPFTRADKASGYSLWYRLVQSYSRRAMTVLDDKLPAISGLASVFAELSKDRYVAGLWEWDLPMGLLWYGNRLVASPRYRAPSWSWAAWDGEINAHRGNGGEIALEDIQPSLALATHDPYGQVTSGHLKVTGHILSVQLGGQQDPTERENLGWLDGDKIVIDDMNGVFTGVAVLDRPVDTFTSARLFCLLVLRINNGFRPFAIDIIDGMKDTAWALVLEALPINEGYKRVGLARMYQAAFSPTKEAITIF
jgi:hypothetical protein